MFAIDEEPYSHRASITISLCLLGWPTQVSTPFGGLIFVGESVPGRRGQILAETAPFSGGHVYARSWVLLQQNMSGMKIRYDLKHTKMLHNGD